MGTESGIEDTQVILDRMTKLYNGYQFTRKSTPGIYNPISVVVSFKINILENIGLPIVAEIIPEYFWPPNV